MGIGNTQLVPLFCLLFLISLYLLIAPFFFHLPLTTPSPFFNNKPPTLLNKPHRHLEQQVSNPSIEEICSFLDLLPSLLASFPAFLPFPAPTGKTEKHPQTKREKHRIPLNPFVCLFVCLLACLFVWLIVRFSLYDWSFFATASASWISSFKAAWSSPNHQAGLTCVGPQTMLKAAKLLSHDPVEWVQLQNSEAVHSPNAVEHGQRVCRFAWAICRRQRPRGCVPAQANGYAPEHQLIDPEI